jgi:hypothetical protein
MNRMLELIRLVHSHEEGHIWAGGPSFLAGIGVIVLAIGAANDNGLTAIIGGVVAALGLMAASLIRHREFDYDMWRRVDKLERK